MALLVRLLWLLVICVPGLRPAHGAERMGDASLVHALQDHAEAVNALEIDILVLIESAPDENRFALYRTYNELMGTWVQVDLLQSLLELSSSATTPSVEDGNRTNLRDHARFALWDLDETRMRLERDAPDADRHEYSRINESIRALLSEAEITISRLLADQCVHFQCASDP